MNIDSITNQIENGFNKFKNESQLPNVMILGATGCGKSTLINTLFDVDIAPTGIGDPVTKGFKKYPGKKFNSSVNFFDSEGWETNTDINSYVENVKWRIQHEQTTGVGIQLIWYCISVAASKIQAFDIDTIKKLLAIDGLEGKLCVVLTKCDEDTEDGEKAKVIIDIIKENFPHINCYQVSNDDKLNKSLDTELLLADSSQKINDEDLRNFFIAGQTQNIKLKHNQANKSVMLHAVAAAGIGASPIPFSQSLLLTPLQIKMLVDLGNIYGIKFFDNLLENGFSSLIPMLGKFLANYLKTSVLGEIIKLVPGGGTIIGGTINATVAGAITYGVGIATSNRLYKTYLNVLDGKNEHFDFSELLNDSEFKQDVANNFEKYFNSKKGKK